VSTPHSSEFPCGKLCECVILTNTITDEVSLGWTFPWDVGFVKENQEPEEAYTMWLSWRKGVAAASQSQETKDELMSKVSFEDGKRFLQVLEFSELWRCEHSSGRSASLAGSRFEQSTQGVDGAASTAVGDSEDAKEPESRETADRGSR
jgi:hypothetical protein